MPHPIHSAIHDSEEAHSLRNVTFTGLCGVAIFGLTCVFSLIMRAMMGIIPFTDGDAGLFVKIAEYYVLTMLLMGCLACAAVELFKAKEE